jgi:hypothetical protein
MSEDFMETTSELLPLNGTYRRVSRVEGESSLSEPFKEIRLRGYEGAVLVRVPEPPSPPSSPWAKSIFTTARADYTINGSTIFRDGQPFVPIGVNAMHCYGSADGRSVPANISIVREYVIMEKQGIHGQWVRQLSDGAWLHPLVPLLETNSNDSLVTIVDLHRWNESVEAQFWAKVPSQTPYFEEYKKLLLGTYVPLVRAHPELWLSVWNEPFMWDGSDDVTAADWHAEFAAILALVRGAGDSACSEVLHPTACVAPLLRFATPSFTPTDSTTSG